MARYALKYEKGENVRWLSHLDIMRTWERALRRSDIPLTYSEGFNPRPKMWFLAPLGVGSTGTAEMMAFDLELPLDPEIIQVKLAHTMPDGLKIHGVWRIDQHGSPFRDDSISTFQFIMSVPEHFSENDIRNAIRSLLSKDVVNVRREKANRIKIVNIRPKIKSLQLADFQSGNAIISAELIQSSDYGVRPYEIIGQLKALMPGLELISMNRTAVQEIPGKNSPCVFAE